MEEQNIREQLAMWLENMLSPEEAADLETRLQESSLYRQEYEKLTRVEHLLKNSAVVGPPAGFADRFAARLASQRGRQRARFGAVLLGLLVMAAVGFGLVLLTSTGLALLEVWTNLSGFGGFVSLLLNVVEWARSIANALILIGRAFIVVLSQPVFAGFLLVSVGLIWLWLQALRRWVPRPSTVTA